MPSKVKISKVNLSKHKLSESISPTKAMIKAIGQQLVNLRKEAGLTQAQINIISGLTPTRIVDLELGRTNYTIESLLTYLEALGKKMSDLK